MAIPPDPRSIKANEDLVDQVSFAPRPLGRERSLIIDLTNFNKDWKSPPKPAPGGIRMQVWNRPMIGKDGTFMKVTLGDYLATYAEGAQRKEELKPEHLQHKQITEAVSGKNGVKLVEFQHQFFIQVHRGEILTGDQLNRLKENEAVWKAATLEDKDLRCTVYDLTSRDHTTDFDSKRSPLRPSARLEIDGLNFRRLLREQCRNFQDDRNRTMGWRLNNGDLLIAFLRDNEDRIQNALIVPAWIAECMRETYMQALIQILPGWTANFPAPDLWIPEADGTPIPQ